MAIDPKEKLHLRMTELQQKLKDSEEKRRKLEKTCDVLITAFREEQRMHYKALNSKYEKFLEDCSIRRKRNDIILKSLCRVEDKAKEIFAKTERLKMLKNHYISYLKQNEYFKADEPDGKTFSPPIKNTTSNEVTSKSVHWKTPFVAEVQEYNAKDSYHHQGSKSTNPTSDFLESEKFEREHSKNSASDLGSDRLYGFLSGKPEGNDFSTSKLDMKPEQDLQDWTIRRNHEQGSEKERSPIRKIQSNDESPSIALSGLSQTQSKVTDFNDFDPRSKPSAVATRPDDSPAMTAWKNQSEIHLPTGQQVSEDAASCEVMPLWDNDSPKNESKLHQAPIDVGHAGEKDSSSLSLKFDSSDLDQVKSLRERGFLRHQESIDKLKMALETDGKDGGKNSFPEEKNWQREKSNCGKINPPSDDGKDGGEETGRKAEIGETGKFGGKNFLEEKKDPTRDEKTICPKGLDGVDYENETYPESYYEQPDHPRDHSNLVSDVILEEDELELGEDQEEEESGRRGSSPTPSSSSSSSSSSTSEDDSHHLPDCRGTIKSRSEIRGGLKEDGGEVENRQFTSDRSESLGSRTEMKFLGRSTGNGNLDESDSSEIERNHTSSSGDKINILRLLESDSESFQIEHGDCGAASGNEDSDFDFTLRQNP